MQEENETKCDFLSRTDALAARLGIDVGGLPEVLGISRASLFRYRSGKSRISGKAWEKLYIAEAEAAPQFTPMELFIIRMRRGLRAADVAGALGVSVEEYSHIERGRAQLPNDKEALARLASLILTDEFRGTPDEHGLYLNQSLENSAFKDEAKKLLNEGKESDAVALAIALLDSYRARPEEIVCLVHAKSVIKEILRLRMAPPPF